MTYSSRWVSLYRRDAPKWKPMPRYFLTKTTEEQIFSWKPKISKQSKLILEENRKRLIEFYQKISPSKVGSVDKLLRKFSPQQLNAALRHKYGKSPLLEPEKKRV